MDRLMSCSITNTSTLLSIKRTRYELAIQILNFKKYPFCVLFILKCINYYQPFPYNPTAWQMSEKQEQ